MSERSSSHRYFWGETAALADSHNAARFPAPVLESDRKQSAALPLFARAGASPARTEGEPPRRAEAPS